MNKESIKAVATILGALLFNILFWQEKMAINLLIFDVFLLGSVFYLYPGAIAKPTGRWLLVGHLVTLAAVVVHNTLLSKLAFHGTLLLLVAFTQYLHRSPWYALGSALLNMLLMVPTFAGGLLALRQRQAKGPGLRKAVRLLVLPMLIVLLFVVVYAFANRVFMQTLSDMGMAVQAFFGRFFSWFGWERLAFVLLGLFITGALLFSVKGNAFLRLDMAQQNGLQRRKRNMQRWRQTTAFDLLTVFMGRFASGMLALRNENTVGIISLALLNGLLLYINVIDIVYVWFGFTYSPNINLSKYVHEGAGLLIFSIVLAMLVLLFFFRGNLNFYRNNHWLRRGAYLWIVQNMVLAVSVLIRDYHYFVHMGMAYKRIGVVVFLILVLAGLLTVFLKIHYRKSNYYLLRVNAWVAVVVLVLGSCIHWDEWIAQHNLSQKGRIPVDVNFLLNLSDKTLPIIEQHKEVLDTAYLKAHNESPYIYNSYATPLQYFELRKLWFFEEQQRYSWLSWNVADAYVRKHLPTLALGSVSIPKNNANID
jgi:hypothetical protein